MQTAAPTAQVSHLNPNSDKSRRMIAQTGVTWSQQVKMGEELVLSAALVHVRTEVGMHIDKDTRVADILREYGDIAEVMEVFGVQRVGRYSVRALAAKALTVEWAARIHRVPLDGFLEILRKAVAPRQPGTNSGAFEPPSNKSGV